MSETFKVVLMNKCILYKKSCLAFKGKVLVICLTKTFLTALLKNSFVPRVSKSSQFKVSFRFFTLISGDANTLSPMENRHVIKSNETSPTKADLMTMSTPPHLLSVALQEGDGTPQRRYYNHRSKFDIQ